MATSSSKPATKRVSLAYEIHGLQRVLEGIIALVDAVKSRVVCESYAR